MGLAVAVATDWAVVASEAEMVEAAVGGFAKLRHKILKTRAVLAAVRATRCWSLHSLVHTCMAHNSPLSALALGWVPVPRGSMSSRWRLWTAMSTEHRHGWLRC